MSRTRQHGKGKKRRKSWHRGQGEFARYQRAVRAGLLQDLGTGMVGNEGTPQRIVYTKGGDKPRMDTA